MTEKHKNVPVGMIDLKHAVSDFISSKFKEIVKSDREKLSDAISLFMSKKTVSKETFDKLKKFYQKDEISRSIFFNILTHFEYEKIELLFNTIYAITDNPLWLIQLADDLDQIISTMNTRKAPEKQEALIRLRMAFRSYFSKIFNLQYLITHEYNANNTPINLLKYIAQKEGIHPASHWSVFEERLNIPEHILLGLEHFKISSQPVVYIEIAFSKGLIKSIHDIIGSGKVRVDLKDADTAVFYSLNSTFEALSGIGLGEKMIIRAKAYIEAHYPQVRQFATLSPIPGFKKFLETVVRDPKASFLISCKMLDEPSKRNRFFTSKNIESIKKEYKKAYPDRDAAFSEILLDVLQSKEWFENPVYFKNMENPLIKLCRHYLTAEKKRDRETGEMLNAVIDPVAHFHFSNGAYIGSINYLANMSDKGLNESFGMMVNYIYAVKKLDSNKIKYSQGIVDSQV